MDFFIMKVKLFFLVITVFIISCSKKELDNDLNQLNLKGNIVSIKEYRHKIDENNKIIFEPRYKSKSVGFYRNDNLKILLDELEK
mgnify:CR=1 FL=1